MRLISFSELDGYRMTRAQPFKDVSPEAPMLEQLTSLSAQVQGAAGCGMVTVDCHVHRSLEVADVSAAASHPGMALVLTII